MEKMGGLHVYLILLLGTLFQGIQGQVIDPSSSDVAVGSDVLLECTTTAPSGFIFIWNHLDNDDTIYSDGRKVPPPGSYDNFYLDEDLTAKQSTLNISSILLQDAGQYQCVVSGQGATVATANVEVGSQVKDIVLESINSDTNYQATCDAIGSYPAENIIWFLAGVRQQTPSTAIVETDPGISDDNLFDKRSVFTFPATFENFNVMLVCDIDGHAVSTLNRQVSRQVDVHNPPESTGIMVGFNSDRTDLTVTCNINDAVDAAIPAMSKFYIYSNGTLIPKSADSDNFVIVTEPEQETEYTCVGGNYLGNTTSTNSYDPSSTTTPPPTTEPITTEGSTTGSTAPESTTPVSQEPIGSQTGTEGLGPGAIAGIAVGAILVIIVIVVLIIVFVLKPDCVKGLGSSSGGGSSKKHGSSSVGSSNGNEKDKFKPTPTPRVQSSMIKHTNENPEHAEYAMVDRKPKPGSGGDMPDTRGNGAGQNEPPGMLYADLDLTAKAGHTEREVPQNPENVVVYSSILV